MHYTCIFCGVQFDECELLWFFLFFCGSHIPADTLFRILLMKKDRQPTKVIMITSLSSGTELQHVADDYAMRIAIGNNKCQVRDAI